VVVNAPRRASPLKTFPALFYPGERQVANATAFDLLLGQEVAIPEMVLDLTRADQNSLTGMVHGAEGKPLKGVSLTLLSVDSQLSDSALSDDEGNFNFENLPSGQYLLRASFNGHAYFKLQQEISIKDQALNKVTVELKPHPLISGRAYLKSQTGIRPLASLKLQLEPAKAVTEKLEILTDKDGNFSTRSSNEGLFWLTVPEPGPQYFLNRITVDRKDITNRPMRIDQASDLRGISVEISTGAAEIRGAIHTSTCEANLVYAVGLDSRTEIQFVREASCLGDSFRIRSLPPGRYYVVGIPTAENINRSNQQPRTKKQGIDDWRYDAIEKAINILQTRGTTPLTLERDQIHENTELVMIDPKTGASIK
ncbi:MAG TPA: carboxypeptidase-like regulatory domain-containing protein, partial [Pyrinomonadaceae bacterium]